jgi:hypothetical protein
VAESEETKNTCRILVGKLLGKFPLGRWKEISG